MKTFILLVLLFGHQLGFAQETKLLIPIHQISELKKGHSVPFISREDPESVESFKNGLAMNLPYSQLVNLRSQVESYTNQTLGFFTGWNPLGEAHITVITPPEFVFTLRHHISMKEINEIATDLSIQNSDLKFLGIGSGRKELEGTIEDTYFILVESDNLLKIRQKIHEKFVSNGGDSSAFNPNEFYPHITIGYTKRDLHLQDGVIKNFENSHDPRFVFIF